MPVTINGNGTITGSINLPAGTQLNGATLNNAKVLQVVNATYSTETSNTSSTYADTGLSATITPSSVSSKILVFVFQTGLQKDSSDTAVGVQLLRGSTALTRFETRGGFTSSSAANVAAGTGITYLDSPGTTSATTYKTQFRSHANSSRALVQESGSTSSITLMEIAA